VIPLLDYFKFAQLCTVLLRRKIFSRGAIDSGRIGAVSRATFATIQQSPAKRNKARLDVCERCCYPPS
jgi:hypothetical protein